MGRRWVTWNVRGLGKSTKREVTKLILNRSRPELVMIQESKLGLEREETVNRWARSLNMEYEFVPSEGASGGIITLWKGSGLNLRRVEKHPRFLVTVFQILPEDACCLVINVYEPNDERDRGSFFADLGVVLDAHVGAYIIGGDFNATLNDGERKETGSNPEGDANFKQFVENHTLVDLPMVGGEYTWHSTRNGGLWSKIDRWVMNDNMILLLNVVSQRLEAWDTSDHRAVTLSWGTRDFGPKPFRFYNHWLAEEDFTKMVEEWWGVKNCGRMVWLHNPAKTKRCTGKDLKLEQE